MPPRKVLIDLQPLQTRSSRDRGIGFYTLNHVTALLRVSQPSEWEIHGLVNAHLALTPKLEELRSKLGEGRWWTLNEGDRNLDVEEREESDRSAIAASIDALCLAEGFSIYHNTSPFEWEVWIPLDLRRVAVVATVYDIIPKLFPDEYLAGASPRFRAEYERILSGLKRADRVVAISECTRRDLVTTLGLGSEQVVVIRGGVDLRFRVLDDPELFARVRGRYGTGERFVLYTGGYDFRKNFERLFEAFSRSRHRAAMKLVVVCRLSDDERRRILAMALAAGLEEREVVLAGFVPDEEQVALYNMAEAMVFPSRYEGFGLPVLEAMTCGTPVIASNRSSMPEIAGDAAILVDPSDPDAIAEALDRLLGDPDRKRELRDRGFGRAGKFTWDGVARRTLEAYAEVRERRSVSARTARARVGFFGPFSPKPTGVADYCERLVFELSRTVNLHLFVDGYEPANPAIRDRFNWDDARLFGAYEKHARFDLALYQMGNSQYHAYVYAALRSRPGVVVLHDLVLHHLIMATTVQKGDEAGYREEMARSHGEEGERVANLVIRGLGSDALYHAYPLLGGVTERAQAILVHSAHAVARLRGAGYDGPVGVVPMGIGGWLFRESERREEERRSLGVGDRDLVIGTFGVQSPMRRHDVLFGAFRELRRRHPRARLLVVGSIPEWYPLASMVERAGIAESVILAGQVSDDRFDSLILASDLCVNLRYPSRGETSAVTLRTMGYGRATLVTDIGSFAEFPSGTFLQVELGRWEAAELAGFLNLLADDADLREELARRARAHVRTRHTPEVSAAAYLESLARFGLMG